ncbi:MAG: hypothetical protein ABI324_24235 [Ktedonobacteraceae bacterium]
MIPQPFPARTLELLLQRATPRYDDPELRLERATGQQAPLTSSGRVQLVSCPFCCQPWVKDQESFHPRVSEEQVRWLITSLGVHLDPQTGLYGLPEALCPICSVATFEGVLSIEEYRISSLGYRAGYRFLWEHEDGTALVCLKSRHPSLDALLRARPDGVLTAPLTHTVRATFESSGRMPAVVLSLTETEQSLFSQRLPARLHRRTTRPKGEDPVWSGFSWPAWCPVFGQTIIVLGTRGTVRETREDFLALFRAWRTVIAMMKAVI